MKRNTKRRLTLYGSAALIALVLILAPRAIKKAAPYVKVRSFDYDALPKHEAVKLLSEYLKIDTTNPPGNTQAAVEFLGRLFDCEGIPFEIVAADPKRPMIVARLSGMAREEALMLLSHMDVVPPGDPSKWDYPPFGGDIGKNLDKVYMYGRGAIDMKSFSIAHFLAMADLKRSGITPLRDVVFVGEPAEETNEQEIGLGWLIKQRPDLIAGVSVVYNEGGVNEVIASDIERYGIEILQKAYAGLLVTGDSKTQLEDFSAFLKREHEKLPRRLLPEVKEHLRFISQGKSYFWGDLARDPDRMAKNDIPEGKELPEMYESLVQDSIITEELAAKPDGAWQMRVLYCALPGSSIAAGKKKIEDWARERGLETAPFLLTPDSKPSTASGRGYQAARRVFELDPLARVPVGPYVLTASYTTCSFLRHHDYRCYGVTPFNINVFDSYRAHNASERINMAHMVEGVERMTRIVREYVTAP